MVMAAATDYKFTGYGIISKGSSVKMFEGTDQQFFLGGKNALTVGVSNTFTVGIKSDVMVGASISMGMAPWDWDKPGGLQTGHLTAKYDFSTNKSFAFQIAPEGSSNYLTQSKFNCELGFQAVGGFQPGGKLIYEAYKTVISRMGKLIALTNLVSSLAVVYTTLDAPAPTEGDKGELKNDLARQNFAKTSAWAATGASTGVATMAAIYAAFQREKSFKPKIHPQSVIDLTKTSVFLGAIGNSMLPSERYGAGLMLKAGKASLNSRAINEIGFDEAREPFADKTFNDFKSKPTAAVEVDPREIRSYADFIGISAGRVDSTDPFVLSLQKARDAYETSFKTVQDLAKKAYEGAKVDLGLLAYVPGVEEAQEEKAVIAKEAALASGAFTIYSFRVLLEKALAYHKINPSLYLSAGTKTGSLLSKIEAEAPNFNVIASNSISLSDTRAPLRGLFIKNKPSTSIKLVNTPVTQEISMAADGTTLKFGVSEIQLKPAEIVIENGLGSLSVKPTGLTFKAGAVTVQITPYIAKFGSGLKIIGA